MVEALEKGFLINVLSEKSCPGLLVSILEAFEELGLNVLEARVSCADNFRLQAVGGDVRSSFYTYTNYDAYTHLSLSLSLKVFSISSNKYVN
jgi:hypothetical protein